MRERREAGSEVPPGSALALIGPVQRARVCKNSETGMLSSVGLRWMRFLDDGRFSMTNTVAERQLHVIAIGRNWILAEFGERVLRTQFNRLRLKILHGGGCMGGSGDG